MKQLNILGEESPLKETELIQELSIETFENLESLKIFVSSCQRCGLCTERTNTVFSRGNPEAKLMIIGEGPGQQEDLSGLPFVGRAGQLLDKILASADIDKDRDVYICNVVKCRPPGNRVPTPDEMEKCRPYLDAQISFIKPKLIILAGATAVQALLKSKDPISRMRGKWYEHSSGAKVMPVFHPSYLLRNDSREVGSPKWLMWQDIKEVARALKELG
ncbi:MAG: uracil-DNA glycosylase [Candidatus Obscuribacterales bacterium]|nr:uracil-DNA glycosylase [Candidatus Obscuribacterales bacterium]